MRVGNEYKALQGTYTLRLYSTCQASCTHFGYVPLQVPPQLPLLYMARDQHFTNNLLQT